MAEEMYDVGMNESLQRMVAEHLDRVRREAAPSRDGVLVEKLENGWVSVQPGAVVGDVPSAGKDRLMWLHPRRALSGADLDEALAVLKRWNRPGGYAWLAPWAWNEHVEMELLARGFKPWPGVEYLALARPAGQEFSAAIDARGQGFEVRALREAEAAGAMRAMSRWYSQDGMDTASNLCRAGKAEAWAAFWDGVPAAFSLLSMDGAFAYLWAMGTDPEYRGKGAQAALIRGRVRRANELGATWCVVEANTAVPISLRNIDRCGFETVIRWRAYQWLAPTGPGACEG
jgi:GNAT superfamily N-acetyltransferase